MSASFGVHVGHSSACLAVQREGRCDVVANDLGDRVTPAVVGYNGDEILVGMAAKQLYTRIPKAVVKNNKMAYQIPEGSMEGTMSGDDCHEIERENGKVEKVQPKRILKEIYKYMHDIAISHATPEEDELNTVVTVPLEFTSDQRVEVAEAATEAGFHVVQVISETASACLAYNLGQLDPVESYKCLIYRCGGQSLTASIVQIQSGMVKIIKSVTKFGIGGNRITELLANFLADEFKRKHRVDPQETKRGTQKLQMNAENVKHILSTLETANCYIESLHEGIDFNTNVTRARFDNELAKIITELVSPIDETLNLVGLKHDDIQKVILAGGTSKIPKVQKTIFGLFKNAEYLSSINPDEVIAVGAANQAGLINEKFLVNESTNNQKSSVKIPAISKSLVYTCNGDSNVAVLLEASTPVPVRRSDHPTLNSDASECEVQFSLQNSNGELTNIAQLKLDGLNSESKVSLSAHFHRDASLHLNLTDKTSGSVAQVTLQ